MTLWEWLLSPDGLTPHGFCLTWAPGLLWLHAGSDAVIGLAYLSIPLALLRFVKLRPDLAYHWIAYLFGAFILACGLTHILAIYTLWVPAYGVEGLVKLVTALLSIATAAILWPLVPKLVALASPAQLRELNGRLSQTVIEQARTAALLRESESRVRAINANLEQRVAERTADLSAANAHLLEALEEKTSAEAALRESEFRMRMAVDAAQLGIWEMDYVENRGRMNPRMSEMTGGDIAPDLWLTLEGDEVKRWTDRIHPDDVATRNRAVAEVREGRQDRVEFRMRVAHPDGNWMWLTQWRAVVARDPETGTPTRGIGLYLDTTERARIEDALRTALAQRDLLLREVYHRVKNNLQIVDGLLLMQSRSLRDPQAIAALVGLRSRIYALGLVHAQLMSSKNLETFDIAPFLQELTQNIVAGGSSQDVVFEVDVCPLEVDLDVALPLGLLVTELVTNSLKHAFPYGAGAVRVKLARMDDRGVLLSVSDNGLGGTETPDTPGVGSSIIAGLVGQLSGKLAVDQQGGRTTTILFPDLESA
jgi:two-component sensor histidine kinase/PAS domain-containing protein